MDTMMMETFWGEFGTVSDSGIDSMDDIASSPSEHDSFHLGSPSSTGFDENDQENSPKSSKTCGSRKQNPVKRLHQRHAANMRERRRMRTINEAFEGLKCRVPSAKYDKKISKVDTLRLAIRYISHLSELVSSCKGYEDPNLDSQASAENRKVIIRYHHNLGYPDCQMEEQQYPPLYGHSLSWVNDRQPQIGPDNKLSAKIWVPEDPRTFENGAMMNYETLDNDLSRL